MITRRFQAIIATVSALVLLVGSAAFADEHGDADTVVNVGYDSENHVLVFNANEFDSTYDCSLENGPLMTGYTVAEDGSVSVDTLDGEEGPVEFPANEEVGEDFDLAEGPATYGGPEEPCVLFATVVAGPNGQINHGQFMKTVKEMIRDLDVRRGCINRIFAKSDLGKGDQQVKTSDVDSEFAVEDSGEVEFTTELATCQKQEKDKTGNAEKKAEIAQKKAEKKAEKAAERAERAAARSEKKAGR